MSKKIQEIINIVFAFLLVLVVGTIAGAFIYSVYTLSTHLVAGESFTGISPLLFVKGLLLAFPVIMLICPASISFNLIRHKPSTWLVAFTFGILYLVGNIFISPLVVSALQKNEWRFYNTVEVSTLSSRYFREDEGYLFYYSKVDEKNVAEGICVDTDSASTELYTFSNVLLPKNVKGFTDPLIKESIQLPDAIRFLRYWCNVYSSLIAVYSQADFLFWLGFCSFCLAMGSVIFLRRVSLWRLVNFILISGTSVLIVMINIGSYRFNRMGTLAAKFNELIGAENSMHNSFAIVFNFVVFLVLMFFGIISYVKSQKDSGEY